MRMLLVQNYSVRIGDSQILFDCSLMLQSGSVHVLMGPNGSGKSSLAISLMGHPAYEVIHGQVMLGEQDLLLLTTHQRSLRGLYLALQSSVEIEGLQCLHFLQEIYSVRQRALGNPLISSAEILTKIRVLLEIVGLSESILQRFVNVGFSGGEKKRFELLQLFLLEPKIIILDEIDSGVDVDGLKMIVQGLLWYKRQCPDVVILIITHYRKIIDYIKPDVVHVMVAGRIVQSGDYKLLDEIEQTGYESYAKRSE